MRQPIPFGKYLLLDRISVGGMAEVFKAKSYGVEGFEKVIAIKRILPSMGEDRDFIKMFIDEAKIAGQLSHANICQIFELGRADNAHFIAMEYIWGKDLLQIQNRFRKIGQEMPITMACYIVSKACEGLDYAHRKKDALGRPLEIVHRDCSPQNVLVSYEGEVKIIDFGIAKAASRSSRTMAGVLKGKFGYMSPEQVRGLPLDRRSDLFALGTILYESLTGERLFLGESDFSTLEKVRNVDIQPPTVLNRNIPPEVEAVVMRALTKDPDDRYQWCSEMRADLQAYLMSQPEVFTAKSLTGWMKTAFDGELSHERRLMEQYKSAGRDGLIAGVPQAHAKLDVVAHLGEAGDTDDPTVLGGPSFEDIIDEAAPSLRASGKQHGDFGDEAPTELFGEVGGDDEPPTYDLMNPVVGPASGVVVADLGAEVAVIGVHAAAQAAEAARAVQLAQAATISPSAGVQAPDISKLGPPPPPVPSFTPPNVFAVPTQPSPVYPGIDSGRFIASGSDPSLFGSTANVTPLPTPTSDLDRLRASQKKGRRRPSIAKDVGIGIAIAVIVLGLFAGGKYLFFGDKPGAREAEASAMGTIAVALPGNEAEADVWLDDEHVGKVAGGEPLTLDPRPVGTYTIKVRRGTNDCQQKVEVTVGKPAIVTCSFTKDPDSGLLVLQGIRDDYTVFFDGQEMSLAAAREPIRLTPGITHSVVVKRGEEVIKELRPTARAGQELSRVLEEAPVVATLAPSPGKPAEPPAVAKESHADSGNAHADRSSSRSTHAHREHSESHPSGHHGADKTESGSKSGDTPANGYLIANTVPWARVWIDGKDTGRSTPIAKRSRLELPPGKHRVLFVFGKQKFPFAVTIEAGKTSKLVEDLPVSE